MVYGRPVTSYCRIFLFWFAFFLCSVSIAQEVHPDKKSLLKDTLDGKLDLSSYIIVAKGLVPIPVIITQPALGGFGGALALLYISPKKRPAGYKGYIPPDITVGMGMYTVNNSWAGGIGQMGSFPAAGIKYRAFIGYGAINLAYYHQFDIIGEKEFKFNIKALPVFLSVSKKIDPLHTYLGLQYLISKNVLKPNFPGSLPDFITSKEMDSQIGSLGLFADFDNRNTIFTPDKGMRINLLYSFDASWTGSDYNYQRIHGFTDWFIPLKRNWISGLHVDVQQAFGNTPFYLLPDINMEGIPTARYQGTTTMVLETEQRYDISFRWSIVGFGGLGKTIGKNQDFSTGTGVYNYGTGFRYYLARAFGLRAGIDIAKGPDSWGYYIIFGQSWNK
jgi:hypothetical protein